MGRGEIDDLVATSRGCARVQVGLLQVRWQQLIWYWTWWV